MRRLVLSAVVLGLVGWPTQAPGQEESASLETVEELARLGRSEEARTALMDWWEATRPDASRRDAQRALWLRGSLTVDPDQAALDFRRLVIEYPGGPFSDQALFRLAQAAHASGDANGANAYMATLARDYPRSPVRRNAESWFENAGPAPDAPRPAPTDGEAEVPEVAPEGEPEVEESSLPEALPTETAPPLTADGPRYAIQLGAFANEERARALHRRARDQELDSRLVRVPGTQLLHVRVGRFDSAGAAGDLLRRIGGMGFVAAMVRDAHREERIRK